jgi:hypothetical protein
MIIQCIAGNEGLNVQPTLQAKTATPSASNQYIYPDDGYDGLSSVTVSGDNNLVASNVKKGVEIFGVTGTYTNETTTTYYMPTVYFAGSASQPDFSMTAGEVIKFIASETSTDLRRPVLSANDGFSTWSATTDSSGTVTSWENLTEAKCTVNDKSWKDESGYDVETSYAGGQCVMPYNVTVTTSNFWNYSPTDWPKGTYKVRLTNFFFPSGFKMCYFAVSSKSFTDSSYDNATLVVNDGGAELTWTVPSTWSGLRTYIDGWEGIDEYESVYGNTYCNLFAQVTKIISFTPE